MSRTHRVSSLAIAGAASAALLLAGCIDGQEAPDLSGPSGFGVNLAMSASPSVLPRDGSSQAVITVVAKDSDGNPVSNVTLVPGVVPGSVPVAAIQNVTGGDGVAQFVVTAPQPQTITQNNQVEFFVTPLGGDVRDFSSKSVAVGILGPSNETYPTPEFTFVPESPVAGSKVVFDASATTDESVVCDTCSFDWDFGDGNNASGRVVDNTFAAGTFAVRLTVTDVTGSASTLTQTVTVAP
jgi:hypothetical protein